MDTGEKIRELDRELRWSFLIKMGTAGVSSCVEKVYGNDVVADHNIWIAMRNRGMNSMKSWKNETITRMIVSSSISQVLAQC